MLPAEREQMLIAAVEQAVGVLHADDPGRQRLPDLIGGDVAEADRLELALVTQGDQLGQLAVHVDDLIALGHQPRRHVGASQVDDRQRLGAE